MNGQDKKLWDFHEIRNRDSFKLGNPRFRFLAKKIPQVVPKGRVLDIGFGDGSLLRGLGLKGLEIFGADISEENVNLTQRLFEKDGIRSNLVCAAIDHLPFANDYFDAVVASEVLEHLDDLTLKAGITEMRRVLKKSGTLFVTFPANENLKDALVYCPTCGNTFHRWGHKQSFDLEKIRQIFSEFGGLSIRAVAFFGQEKPSVGIVNKLKYIIKIGTFHLSRQILGADYRYYLKIKKL